MSAEQREKTTVVDVAMVFFAQCFELAGKFRWTFDSEWRGKCTMKG